MCGIVGYIGKNVEQNLYTSLVKLQYRGYDSAGIAIKRKSLRVYKTVGSVTKLKRKIMFDESFGIGIGHTRWATHGKVCVKNCHPHISQNKTWAIVHNGIIENYKELTNKYNLVCQGQTDSEVISNLLEKQNVRNIYDFITTISLLKGSYAICALNSHDSSIYIAKNKSPLYVQILDNSISVSSDTVAFKRGQFYTLEDNEFAVINKNEVQFFDNKGIQIFKKPQLNDYVYSETRQSKLPFMYQEIMQTPQVIDNIVNYYQHFKCDFSPHRIVHIIGCGTSYHSGLMAEKFMRKSQFVKVYLASEYRYSPPPIDKETLAIFVSQSGETADTLAAMEYAKHKGAKTIAITNVLISSLAKKADYVLPLCAGPEIAVASTKVYTAQLIVFKILGLALSNKPISNFLTKLRRLKESINKIDHTKIKRVAKSIKNRQHIFFIGKDYDYVNCLEGALKLKEVTYLNCNAFASGELKHGVITLITPKAPVIALITDQNLAPKVQNSIYEIKARKGIVYAFTTLKTQNNRDVILPNLSPDIMPMYACVYFQLLAYYCARYKHINPDKPRNLAKSVTVE